MNLNLTFIFITRTPQGLLETPMTARKVRGISWKFADQAGIVLAVGVAGLVAVAGCSSDADVDGSPAGAGGKAAAGAAGRAGGGGKGGAAIGGSEDVAGAAPVGEGGAAGTPDDVTPPGDGGAAGEGSGVPFTLHLSPTLTPKTVNITAGGHDRFYGVTFDADGNIYAVGVTAPGILATTDFATVVAKFSPAGVLDTTFGSDGYAIRNVAVGAAGELARGIAIQPDGKIVISTSIEATGVGLDARDRDLAVLRYLPNGKKDTTFGEDGIVKFSLSDGLLVGTAFLADSVWGMSMYPDGRLVLNAGMVSAAKTDTNFAIVRLSADGAFDDTFGNQGVYQHDTLVGATGSASNNASPRNLTLLPGTQGIIGAGYQPVPGADTKPCVFHVTDKGQLDTAFGVDGTFSEAVFTEQTETYAAVPQSTGKLVTTGYARELSTETTDILSMRLNVNGKRDLTYGTAGALKLDIGGFGDNSRNLIVLPNDHVILVGGGRPVTDNVDGVVVALTADGKPETTFSATGWKTLDLGGPADFLWGAALSPSKTSVAAVGIKGAGAAVGAGDDDAVLLILKLVE